MSDPQLPASDEHAESPMHGFRGEALDTTPLRSVGGLTIAITRETGSRGASIANRVGSRLGWQVYTQDLLEYLSQDGNFLQELSSQLSQENKSWIEDHLERLLKEQNLSRNPSVLEMARIIFALGTQGNIVLVGRGAGCILPRSATLHVRLVAPEPDRIAYLSQWQRLTEEEATNEVRKRDQQRAEFLMTHFHRQASDVHMYDMLLNTSLLGEELSADLIVHAAQAKQEVLKSAQGS